MNEPLQTEVARLFEDSGVQVSGHTQFKNGWHGNGWIEKGYIVRNPDLLDEVTSHQAEQIRGNFPGTELIVGPTTVGVILASYVARHLGVNFAMAVTEIDSVKFHRMYQPGKGMKAILVDDLAFTGTEIEQVLGFLNEYGLSVEGVSVWMNRSGDTIAGAKVLSLAQPPYEKYLADECPLCKQGVPIEYTGIRE